MSKTKLFDMDSEREHYTELAFEYEKQIYPHLKELVQRAKKDNVSIRDLHYLLNSAVIDVCLIELL